MGEQRGPGVWEGRVSETDRDIRIDMGDGAVMTVPKREWLWSLVWVDPEPERGTKCGDRMLAVSSLESYLYLLTECTKKEAWRRIKIIRAALHSMQECGEPTEAPHD